MGVYVFSSLGLSVMPWIFSHLSFIHIFVGYPPRNELLDVLSFVDIVKCWTNSCYKAVLPHRYVWESPEWQPEDFEQRNGMIWFLSSLWQPCWGWGWEQYWGSWCHPGSDQHRGGGKWQDPGHPLNTRSWGLAHRLHVRHKTGWIEWLCLIN